MGFVRKTLGVDITGGGARRAAERAAEGQAVAGEQAIAGIQEAGAPFAQLGTDTAALLQNLLTQQQPQTPTFQAGALPQLQSPEATLNNPFFQALSQQLSDFRTATVRSMLRWRKRSSARSAPKLLT